jgi:DNA ligase-associated metallophosphoesterase|tara:strand:+ start:270 stop:917 length:648 start_codon:yes stop_codon:yes gene_type:complete
MKSICKTIHNQTFTFDYRKVVFWEEASILILSDVHIGKITHFRKNGISLPSSPSVNNLNSLKSAIEDYHPKEVVFLGDLFHSDYNLEWEQWLLFFKFSNLSFKLIIGNHDSINFKIENLSILKYWNKHPFHFSHYPVKDLEIFNLCGHIHPSFVLRGKGRQKIKLPCFYISTNQLIFPSFGAFTGTHIIHLKKSADEIILISKNGLFPLEQPDSF